MKDLKIFTNNIEQKAKEQIDLLLEQEAFKDCKIRIMPDVHAGAGCVIGFTGNLGDKVIPNIVGVDIGCGMLCVELGKIDIDLAALDDFIKNKIPSGFEVHTDDWEDVDKNYAEELIRNLHCKKELRNKERLINSMGTLGGGNHFIEIDIDEFENKYLIIHTGSRNLGKQVAEIYQEKAIKHCSYKEEEQKEKEALINECKATGRENEISIGLKAISDKYKDLAKLPKDLCYLEGKEREEYLEDMSLCQGFARINRENIANTILLNFLEPGKFLCFRMRFDTVHNYISFADNIVRKGAISARLGECVLIPMNMKDGCIVACGKGNEDWNCSAPHGAGRIMSRMEAKEKLDLAEFKKQMDGIYSTSVCEETIDEAPMVYKPMQEIINNIGDTVAILKIIKPIYNFKAKEVKKENKNVDTN